MLKIPCFCEIRKLARSKLQPVVTHHLVWYAIADKVTLQLQNGGAGFGVWQSVHPTEIAIVVYGDLVNLSIEVKKVCSNLLPRTGRAIVGDQCLSGESHTVEFPTRFACGNELFHFCRHAFPVNAFTGTPQTCFYSEVGRVNLNLHKAPRDNDRISSENQPMVNGQFVAHAEVREIQSWGIVLMFRPPYENSL